MKLPQPPAWWVGPTTQSPDEQLMGAIRTAYGKAPASITMDGAIHRFDSEPGDKAMWYIAHPDGLPAGMFGSWKDGTSSLWHAMCDHDLTQSERDDLETKYAKAKAEREAKQAEVQSDAAAQARKTWEGLAPASDDNPYLLRKGVKPHGIRQTSDGKLVIPLHQGDGISTLQFISADGTKRMLTGGRKKGAFHLMGDITDASTIFVAEGYATSASIFEATGMATVMAVDAGNLSPVGEELRESFPYARVVFVADNDQSNVGEDKARQAAELCNGEVVLIPTLGMDANDWVQAGNDLKALLMPQSQQWLEDGNEYLHGTPEPLRWLIKGWLQQGGVSMIHGTSGSGKTFVVLDWLLHMSTGMGSWMGKPVHGGACVYLCGEGHHGLRMRVRAWACEHGITDLGTFLVSQGATDFDKLCGLRTAVSAIDAAGITPKVVAIDTFNRFMSGDENSAKDTRNFMNNCNALVDRYGCSVLIVHHTGLAVEAQGRARGSSAIKGALDNEISVSREGSDLTLTQTKMKDSEPLDPMALELCAVTLPGVVDDDGEPVTSAVVRSRLADDEPQCSSQMADDLGLFLAAWIACGKVAKDGRPYIERQDFKSFLTFRGMTRDVVNNCFRAGRGRVSKMMSDGLLGMDGNAYFALSPLLISAITLAGERRQNNG